VVSNNTRILKRPRLSLTDAPLQAELQMANEAKSHAAAEFQARKVAEAKLKADMALAEERKKAAKLASKREELERNVNVKRKALEETERRNKAERRATTEEEYHRPIGCNVPFAYLVRGKCYQLASKSPVFDLQDLVNLNDAVDTNTYKQQRRM
jgi:hypothetical protein